ncbi:MAG: hypothetical protein R3B70_20240 [Polyangiaceae bacterium]
MIRSLALGFAASFALLSVGCVAPAPDQGEDASPVAGALGNGGGGSVTVCHIPPGNPANAHTITVGSSAVPAHLAHGDTLGACDDDGDGGDGGDDGSGGSGDGSGGSGAGGSSGGAGGIGGSDGGSGGGSGMCEPDGAVCGADADCCNGICGGSGICTATCTVGPEAGGPECTQQSDCCDGACLYGSCFEGETCKLPGTACNSADESDWCCFGTSCINNMCQ